MVMDIILIFLGWVIPVLFAYYVVRFWWRRRQRQGFLLFFTEELLFTVESNLPLAPSLQVLAEDIKKIYFRKVIENVRRGIEEGETLAQSLSGERHIFSPLYVKMVEMGEKSGNLAKTLREVLHGLRTGEKFSRELKASLAYPCLLTLIALNQLSFIMIFIMPTFERMFTDIGVPLPRLTLFLISLSSGFRHSVLLVFLGILVFVTLIIAGIRANRHSASCNRVLMRVPFLGKLMRDIALIRFSRNLAMFLRSSYSLPQALKSIAEIPFSRAFQNGALSLQKEVEEGETLSDTIGKTGLFPSTAIWFASLGEERGNLEEAFGQIADYHTLAVEGALRKINALTVPIATIIIGGFVGCIVIGLFSALINMVEVLL